MPSTTASTDLSPNTIRVKLVKDKHGGLGFLVKQRKLKPFVLVANIVAGGVAEESGLVQVGDIILRINDIDMTDMSYPSAVEVLKAVPLDTPVVMLLRGPEGYTTYLQTSFHENGQPKTIRVTKAIQETLMGRLKKTFTGSSGPMSPVKSIKKFCNGETEKLDSLMGKDGIHDRSGGGGDGGGGGGGGDGDGGGGGGCRNTFVSVEELDELKKNCRIYTTGYVGNGGVVGVDIGGQKFSGQGGGVLHNGRVVGDNSPNHNQSHNPASISDKSKFLFSREGRVESEEETVLDNGAIGSPKIVLTSPKSSNSSKDGDDRVRKIEDGTGNGCPHPSSQRKAIEIVQEEDKIMVLVRGDINVRSEEYGDESGTTQSRFVISTCTSSSGTASSTNNSNNNNNNKTNNGHTSCQHHHHHQDYTDGSRHTDTNASHNNNSNNNNSNGSGGVISGRRDSASAASDAIGVKTHSGTGRSNGYGEIGNGGRNGRRSSGRASPRRGRSPVTSPTFGAKAGDASDDESNNSTPRGRRIEKKRTSSPTLGRRRSTDRRSSINAMASPKRFVKIKNVMDEKRTTIDTLHTKSISTASCTSERCFGSMMMMGKPAGPPRAGEELLIQAKDFIDQYFTSIKRFNTPSHQQRWAEIQESVERSGTYDLTSQELNFGAKLAWRNAPRCIGRIQWSKLQVFDARHILTARGMYEAICNHVKYATNKGNLRSAITVFPHRKEGRGDFRIWNAQLLRYAGYKMEDGSIVGDPASVEFTDVCIKLGWRPKYGRFDILPIIVSAAGSDPEWFEVPQELALEVNMKHPKYPWFADLGLKWYALPAVSGMLFDCGGLEFTASPFNGWYMGTEIGARDFCDSGRYNMLETIGLKMGLDTRKTSSLWKDRVLVECNVAVLHSFQTANVTITDHHAASASFMKHLENEQKLRGGCPADWVWVVPPMSGSILEVFHQEMLMYNLKPSYEYQDDPWKTHIWKKDKDKPKSGEKPKRKFGFKELARAVKFSAKLMGKALARRVKCTILYATETGKSERFANTLCEIFKHAFDAKVMCMDEYDVLNLEHESLVLVVTSTFGNGDPPENGEAFAKSLYEMKPSELVNGDIAQSHSSYVRMSISREDEVKDVIGDAGELNIITGPLGNVRFSVFALGSKAYPHYAAFGHYMDKIFSELGAEKIFQIGDGDELCAQEESFRKWAEGVFKAACETFCLGDDVNMNEATDALNNTDHQWTPTRFRVMPYNEGKDPDICEALSKTHGKKIIPCLLKERVQLQSPESDRQTILVKLDTQNDDTMNYLPGDHVGIYPANDPALVNAILVRLHNAPPPDMVIKTEYLHELSTPLGTTKTWTQFEKMPVCSLRMAFTHVVDITTPPSQALLQLLATQASRDIDRERLEMLATDSNAYEDWKYDLSPNVLEVLDQFSSLKVPPSLLLTQLPLLQQRYYSISSSNQVTPGDIHATIAVVKFRTQNGAGPIHEGVCSSWLNKSDDGITVPAVVRSAPTFHLPENKKLPVLMVGPGTGIAPFRSFWQQRLNEMELASDNDRKTMFGKMFMYFGCRYAVQDNIYRTEMEEYKKLGVLTDYLVALSREAGMPKVYVQDILLNNADEVYDAIANQGGHFFVCGDVSMAHDVTRTLENILQDHGKMSPDEASKFVTKLRDTNRFHEDIFGVSIRRSGEQVERSKDQSMRALEYLNALTKPAKPEKLKEKAVPIQAS